MFDDPGMENQLADLVRREPRPEHRCKPWRRHGIENPLPRHTDQEQHGNRQELGSPGRAKVQGDPQAQGRREPAVNRNNATIIAGMLIGWSDPARIPAATSIRINSTNSLPRFIAPAILANTTSRAVRSVAVRLIQVSPSCSEAIAAAAPPRPTRSPRGTASARSRGCTSRTPFVLFVEDRCRKRSRNPTTPGWRRSDPDGIIRQKAPADRRQQETNEPCKPACAACVQLLPEHGAIAQDGPPCEPG